MKLKKVFLLTLAVFFLGSNMVFASEYSTKSDSNQYLELNLIDNIGVSPNYSVPLKEASEKLYKYFSKAYWKRNDNGYNLALFPRKILWTENAKAEAWLAVYATFHKDSQWKNTKIMKQQFYCHARLAYQILEKEWNLEPWKTKMNNITCN